MIIFLYGEDEFRSQRKLAEIKNKFLEKNKEGGTLFVFDFVESAAKIGEMLLKLSSGGLFSNKKLAIVKNILQSKAVADDKEFLDFLKGKDKGEMKDLTLIFWEREKFDKKLKLAKFILEKSKKQEFKLLDGIRLKNWIIEETRLRQGFGGQVGEDKISISPKAAEKLSIYVGNNLFLLSKEIEKLVDYKSEGKISEEDVDLLVKSKIDTDIFRTLDALSQGDKKTAVKFLHEHIESGDHPLYMLDRYFYQFRNLLKVKSLAEKNMPQPEIASKLKLHPYVVKKSLEQGQGFSLDKLKELYKNLCQIDFETKTGKIEIELALDRFVAMI